jgi:hypothetical protein
MGITIHFEGKLKRGQDLSAVLEHARLFAKNRVWTYVNVPEEVRSLLRVRNDEDWDYVGLTSGIEIYTDEACESLRLESDADGYIQEYVKTQFSPIEVYIAIIDLLKDLQQFFIDLEVVDESDYWETNDVHSL